MSKAWVVSMCVVAGCGSANIVTGTGGGTAMGVDGGAGGGSAGGSSGGGASGGSAAGGMAGGSAGGASGGRAGGSAVGGGSSGGNVAGGSTAGGSAGGIAACSPSSCAGGCCLNGTCQPGTQSLACGTNGSVCVQCAMGDPCSNQRCGPDLTRRYQVRAVSAVVDGTKANGSGWDTSGGAPDTYADLYCPSSRSTPTSSTEILTDDPSPTWTMGSCTLTAGELTSTGFAFQLFDRDAFAHDQIAPKTTIVVTQADLTAGTLTHGPVDSCQSIVFSFTPM